MFERFFRRLGRLLVDDKKRGRLLGCFRSLFLILSIGLLLIYVGLAFLQPFMGERNLTTMFILFLPRQAFLLPLAASIPLTLIFHWRSAMIQLAGGLIYLFFGMGYQIGGQSDPTPSSVPGTLTVMTYNRGQHANQSLQPFKNLTKPDIIAFQESGGRAKRYANAAGYEDLPHTDNIGEFTFLSRYPILSKSLIEIPGDTGVRRPAARFEIDFHGTPVAVYSVHVMSPRGALLAMRGGAFLYGIIGIPGTPWADDRRHYEAYWHDRIDLTRQLLEIVDKDPLPTLVVGDFNATAGGLIHRMAKESLTDAHETVGHGFGFSFPGTTRNPLSLGGPWMRIDYLFCDDHWEPNWCITEADRPSQHRAVAAQFQLLPKP